MPKDIYIRNVPEPVQEAINRLFAGQPTRGHTSPAQGWHRSIICIGALGPDLDVPALELWHAAQRIAAKRHDGVMHDGESAKALFFQEFIDFERLVVDSSPCVKILNRLSNLVYYAVYQYTQDYDIRDFQETIAYLCGKAHVSVIAAMRIASAKYLDRSMRESKDVPSEEKEMLRVFEQFSEQH